MKCSFSIKYLFRDNHFIKRYYFFRQYLIFGNIFIFYRFLLYTSTSAAAHRTGERLIILCHF